ncbi:UNVERIFIED_CONTAM: hypothetical protein GTU68_019333 [Idotea baltica]|nr:hypothetical protein [Idotea baltica]
MLTRRSTLGALFTLPLAPALTRPGLLPWHTRLIRAAREQIGVTLTYDPAYIGLAYPGGDVDRSKGVCTDVVIRAYRDAFTFDLQKVVHEDMKQNFARYPKTWGLSRPDKNIDHRRVPNLETYLKRQNAELDVPASPKDWKPGDLYTMRLGGRLPHIGIVSDVRAPSGRYKIVHNIGAGTAQDDLIGQHKNERRFRFQPPKIA